MGDERARAAHHREELAWAAGLYDGEGSCGCYGRPDGKKRKASYWHIRINVAQHYDPEVLHRFVAAVGIGKVYGPYQEHKYSVQVVGKNAEILIEKLWPWLSGPKRRQIEAAREKFSQRPESSPQGLGGTKPCPPGCTCGRHNRYSTEGLTDKQLRRRVKMREYQARHRARKKEAKVMEKVKVGDLVQVGSNDPSEDGKIYEVIRKGETDASLRCMETSAEITLPLDGRAKLKESA